MTRSARDLWISLANLLIPGGGAILLDAPVSGLLFGLVFAITANATIATALLFPDEYPRSMSWAAFAAAAASYIAAQLWLLRLMQRRQQATHVAHRRALLQEAQQRVAAGDFAAARACLERVPPATDDLLVLLRMAQLLIAAGDRDGARRAADQLSAADRHGIYRERLREFREAMSAAE